MRLPATVPPWALYVLLGAGLYVALRGVNGFAKDTAKGLAKLPGSVIEGLVDGIGESIGVPEVNAEQCRDARASGTLWQVAKVCPLSEYLAETGKRAAGVLKGERNISIF